MPIAMPSAARLLLTLLLLGSTPAWPQEPSLPAVTVSGAQSPPAVEKSYRRMLRGMDLFEAERDTLAPYATLRFKLLPRKPGVSIDDVDLNILSRSGAIPVKVDKDRSFVLPRHPQAIEENAIVTPDRIARTMTWRADVRTPGLPPGVRRLGDLRLECRVGMEAGLVSEIPVAFIGRLVSAIFDRPSYCESADNRYIFFADHPVFGVTLVHGERREAQPVERLWAGAVGSRRVQEDLPYCDCEVMLDRAFFLPLHDRGWPDDTWVVFEPMEARHAAP